MGDNGDNGHELESGGNGGASLAESQVIADLGTRRKSRETLKMLETMATKGWSVPSQWKEQLPKILAQIAADPEQDDRNRLRALGVLRAMEADNANLLIELYKLQRLDGGETTDVVELRPMNIPGGRRL
jgi:hypothetical protein